MKAVILGLFFTLAMISNAAFADINDRINNCEASGGGACVFNILRELANNSTGGGGNTQTTAFVAYQCDSVSSSLKITTTNALTRETFSFAYSDFARFRFSCVSSFLDDLNQVTTVHDQQTVAACDPRSLMILKFRVSPIASASFAGYGEFYPDLDSCRAAAAAQN